MQKVANLIQYAIRIAVWGCKCLELAVVQSHALSDIKTSFITMSQFWKYVNLQIYIYINTYYHNKKIKDLKLH